MLSHTQDAWTGPEDCRETNSGFKKVKAFTGLCEVSAMTQDGWNGDPQQPAQRPVQGFCSCRGGLRVENDLLSVRSHELFLTCPTGDFATLKGSNGSR